jgi:hypothetical protein
MRGKKGIEKVEPGRLAMVTVNEAAVPAVPAGETDRSS